MIKFDLDIKKHVEAVIKIAENKLTVNRSYVMGVTFFDDGDYEIILKSSWGDRQDWFLYRKSTNKYYYEQIKNDELWQMIDDIDVEKILSKEEIK